MNSLQASPLLEMLGTFDELIGLVNWCKEACQDDHEFGSRKIRHILHDVQDNLFIVKAEIAGAQKSLPLSSAEHLGVLIGQINASRAPTTSVVFAGGTEVSSRLDVVCAASRRTLRQLAAFHDASSNQISRSSRAYITRIPALLHGLSKLVNSGTVVQTS